MAPSSRSPALSLILLEHCLGGIAHAAQEDVNHAAITEALDAAEMVELTVPAFSAERGYVSVFGHVL